ncbi:hypothetical protein [Streptomyces sp. 900105755]
MHAYHLRFAAQHPELLGGLPLCRRTFVTSSPAITVRATVI